MIGNIKIQNIFYIVKISRSIEVNKFINLKKNKSLFKGFLLFLKS
jgi:hypothetical protein